MKHQFAYFFSVLLLTIITIACAKRSRPSGGPKDEVAPVLISAKPTNFTTNFSEKEIKISFDEYIKLKDLNKQLIVSPPLKYPPQIEPLGIASKSITIKILDTLKENTTYTFNFGQSVVDNNEENVFNNFKYVFSTGPVLDSLSVKGSLSDSFNREAEENITIMLYEINKAFTDSIIYKEKPLFVANSLDTTVWEISNIKAGKYLLLALKDAARDYSFNPRQDKIAFLERHISVPTDSTYHLKLFKEELEYELKRPSEVSMGHLYLAYEGQGDDIEIMPLNENDGFRGLSIFEKEKDSINYWYKGQRSDSLVLKVQNRSQTDTLVVKLRNKTIDSLSLTGSARRVLDLRDQFKLRSNIPLETIDSSKISLINRDSLKEDFKTSLLEKNQELLIDFEVKNNEKYSLEILPGAITDFFGNKNDSIRFELNTKQPADYGNVYLTLQNVESYPVIVQLLNERDELVEEIYAQEEEVFSFLNLPPRKYIFRIIIDENKNRKWDTGNFLNKIQPEKVIYYLEEINVRANWEMPITFILN